MTFSHYARLVLSWGCLLVTTATAIAADRPYPHAPPWVADQTLYEVNLRQFSAAGNIDGFTPQLLRLQQLGVGIVWFMPVNPIGVMARSGKLGSPYAVQNYTQFNPEFGTLEQFKAAVDQAHRLGMYVLIDWVAAHTAPDNPWVAAHPDWYRHDTQGQLVHTMPTWLDVVALDYGRPEMRKAMIDAMSYWVGDVGIDGFRCDSAEFVPLDFWCDARDALRRIKPVFMLAEGNKPELVQYAFDSAYAWNLAPNIEGIVKGTKNAVDLTNFFKAEATLLTGEGFRLYFTTNHDKNAWEGTTSEQLDGGTNAFTVLTFTAPGMPLIYNGQEAGLNKRLSFFDHDPIDWHDDPVAGLYRKLSQLKRNHPVLWDGLKPAPMQFVTNDANPAVLTFHREAGNDRVVVMLNLSPRPAQMPTPESAANLRTVLDSNMSKGGGDSVELKPWGYRVWSSAP